MVEQLTIITVTLSHGRTERRLCKRKKMGKIKKGELYFLPSLTGLFPFHSGKAPASFLSFLLLSSSSWTWTGIHFFSSKAFSFSIQTQKRMIDARIAVFLFTCDSFSLFTAFDAEAKFPGERVREENF
jgi:hypothetical protein